VNASELGISTHEQSLSFLKQQGFKVNPESRNVKGMDQVLHYIHDYENKRPVLAYDTDGIVIKEASAHSLPSLVLTNTSVSDLIENNQNGFIQDGDATQFADRIINIFLDDDKRKLVGLNAKASLIKSWNETLSSLIPSYESIIHDYYLN
jgi:glycosyltransferase involved in cell wall biosynthesis